MRPQAIPAHLHLHLQMEVIDLYDWDRRATYLVSRLYHMIFILTRFLCPCPLLNNKLGYCRENADTITSTD